MCYYILETAPDQSVGVDAVAQPTVTRELSG